MRHILCVLIANSNAKHGIHTYMWSVRSPAYNGAEELQVGFCVNGCALSSVVSTDPVVNTGRQFELGYKTTVATMSVAWLYKSCGCGHLKCQCCFVLCCPSAYRLRCLINAMAILKNPTSIPLLSALKGVKLIELGVIWMDNWVDINT